MTDKSAYGAREERSAQAAGIAGYCFLIGMPACVALAFLFGQFRHVMPDVREWLLVNGDAVREVVLRWVA